MNKAVTVFTVIIWFGLIVACIHFSGWKSWSPLTSIIMAGITAIMTICTKMMADKTKEMADETKLSRLENERYKKKTAFQRTLVGLAWDIQQHKQELNAKLLNDLVMLRGKSVDLKNKPTELIDKELQKDFNYQNFKDEWLSLRLYQRQLAFYIVAEAKRQGFQEIAEAFEATSIFEPTSDMAKLSPFENQFSLLPPEPDEPHYLKCKREELLIKAKHKAEENSRIMKELLDAGGV